MSSKSYPHPVLDPAGADYPNCGIQFEASMHPGPTTYRFDLRFEVGSDSLLDHIEAGDAIYAVQIDSKWTNYREVFQFSEATRHIEVPEHKLRGIFFLRPFIVAKQAFTLGSGEFADVFSGVAFPMRRGYVLGWDNPLEFDASKTLDDLKNINSVLQIVRNPKDNVPVEYNLDSDKIEIHLSQPDYDAYSAVKGLAGHRSTLMCVLALPAVTYAIKTFLEDKDRNSEARWIHVIERRLQDLRNAGAHEDDPFKLAQAMLDLPISRAIQAIYSLEGEAA
ncbi:hypothetical protein [Solimonas sp. K1W22B-7]|uniref:hypothetical protein n=1 Tax=Solimonas sp. K1W22B-7 TaxID=2303331 RepID=UPI0013C4A066|nr:hypothetical protein [Solimonas sp. K1W22B-7]